MRTSAGLLIYRRRDVPEVFLVHPGGPFWQGKDAGAWSIPKGEIGEKEDPLLAAQREFSEETGQRISGPYQELIPVKQKGGKLVLAWAVEADVDASNIYSNSIRIEYPYKSGKWIVVPEVDKAAWLSLPAAKEKINAAQVNLLEQLERFLGV